MTEESNARPRFTQLRKIERKAKYMEFNTFLSVITFIRFKWK